MNQKPVPTHLTSAHYTKAMHYTALFVTMICTVLFNIFSLKKFVLMYILRKLQSMISLDLYDRMYIYFA